MRNLLKNLLLLGLISLLPVAVLGQAISGNIVGVVRDTTGAVVPGATVDATNLATGFKASATTNDNGQYHFVDLPAGHYKLQATSGGLKGGYEDLVVALNETRTANITAAVAGATDRKSTRLNSSHADISYAVFV